MAEAEPADRRKMWITLIAMTVSSAMILVDQTSVPLAIPHAMDDLGGDPSVASWILTANMLPLAAFMVLGGRLGDIFGLRKIFIIGAVVFAGASAFAGFAQDVPWMITARAVQGAGAALMMPTAVAIVSATFPREEKGKALGLLAGFAAFAAALGPVIGGGLASIDWRLVFLVNTPLAVITILLALNATRPLKLNADASRNLDLPGVTVFSIGIVGFVFGLSQAAQLGMGSPQVLVPVGVSILAFIGFWFVEKRSANPMIDFRLFRHLNFLASNISQFLAGMIELGTAYLLPYFLLMMIGLTPIQAGIALIPATVPIMLAGPLAGRMFDRVGGRIPLTVGFLVLAASGIAFALVVSEREYVLLLPGLILQGIGLGMVLTVNDPTGLDSVPPEDQGQASGMINTSEQLGGAVGIAFLSAVLVNESIHRTNEALAEKGIHPTAAQANEWKNFIQTINAQGLGSIDISKQSETIRFALNDVLNAHVAGYELVFYSTAGIALLGAIFCFFLVRKTDRTEPSRVFVRRSRWVTSNTGRTPALTKHPPPPDRIPESEA